MSFLRNIFGQNKPPDITDLEAKKDIEGLIKALDYEEDHYIQTGAASVLGKLGEKKAVIPLIKLLESPNRDLKVGAALAFAKLKDVNAVEPLLRVLDDSNYDTDTSLRSFIIEALGEIGDTRAAESLVNIIISEKSDSVRDKAMRALLRLESSSAIKPLVSALNRKDEEFHIRMRAAAMLGHLKNDQAVDPLIAALQDEVWNVRSTVAWALGEIADARAIEPLKNIIEDSNLQVQKEVKQALASIERSVAKKESMKNSSGSISIEAHHTNRSGINLRIKGGEPNTDYEITYSDGTKHKVTTDEKGYVLDHYDAFNMSKALGEILINPGGHIISSKLSQYSGFND